jgi:hypothetical protein
LQRRRRTTKAPDDAGALQQMKLDQPAVNISRSPGTELVVHADTKNGVRDAGTTVAAQYVALSA